MMCVNKRTIPTGAPLATGAFLAEFVGLTHGSNDFAANGTFSSLAPGAGATPCSGGGAGCCCERAALSSPQSANGASAAPTVEYHLFDSFVTRPDADASSARWAARNSGRPRQNSRRKRARAESCRASYLST